jgi:hypothetical protein
MMKNMVGLLAVKEVRQAVMSKTTNKRYSHWFWNSWLISWLEGVSMRFSSYLWRKQYARLDD